MTLTNRQSRHRLNLSKLRKQTDRALSILAPRLPTDLEEIDVYLVTPAAIARIHADFMEDPTPTDVITFQHGEIFVCPDIAQKQRKSTGLTLHDETLTYILHGCLHLCGQDDHSPADFKKMAKLQSGLLSMVHSL